MASPAAPLDSARTISHMNKDHKDDLILYLRHFAGLSPSAAADPEMLDLNLTTMTIRSASGTHTVPVVPPMATWSDRRVRLVEMSHAAQKALAPPVKITTFEPPRGLDWAVFGAVAFYFTSLGAVLSGLVEPGTALWDALVVVRFPFGPWLFKWLVKTIAPLVFAIHTGEMWYLDRTRLHPYGVRRGSTVWFLWLGANFFDGFRTYKRFDALVKRTEAEGRKSH